MTQNGEAGPNSLLCSAGGETIILSDGDVRHGRMALQDNFPTDCGCMCGGTRSGWVQGLRRRWHGDVRASSARPNTPTYSRGLVGAHEAECGTNGSVAPRSSRQGVVEVFVATPGRIRQMIHPWPSRVDGPEPTVLVSPLLLRGLDRDFVIRDQGRHSHIGPGRRGCWPVAPPSNRPSALCAFLNDDARFASSSTSRFADSNETTTGPCLHSSPGAVRRDTPSSLSSGSTAVVFFFPHPQAMSIATSNAIRMSGSGLLARPGRDEQILARRIGSR